MVSASLKCNWFTGRKLNQEIKLLLVGHWNQGLCDLDRSTLIFFCPWYVNRAPPLLPHVDTWVFLTCPVSECSPHKQKFSLSLEGRGEFRTMWNSGVWPNLVTQGNQQRRTLEPGREPFGIQKTLGCPYWWMITGLDAPQLNDLSTHPQASSQARLV